METGRVVLCSTNGVFVTILIIKAHKKSAESESILGKKNPFLLLRFLLKTKSTTANKKSPACFKGKSHENNKDSSVTGAVKNGGTIRNKNIREKTIISYMTDLCFIFELNVLY